MKHKHPTVVVSKDVKRPGRGPQVRWTKEIRKMTGVIWMTKTLDRK